MTTVQIINRSENELPKYQTEGSSGMDIQANLKSPITLMSGERQLISTGLYFNISDGYEGQVRPINSLATNYGITIVDSPRTLSSDYTEQLKILLINQGQESVVIENGDIIAQLVFSRVEKAILEEKEELLFIKN